MPEPDIARAADAVRRISRSHHLLLLFDFDGTLCDFSLDPAAVWLPDARRDLLLTIEASRRATLAIVSGRRLDDVRRRAGLPLSVYCAGLHGLEIEGGGEHFVHPDADAAAELLAGLARTLARDLSGMPGVFVEDKTLSIVAHYRGASDVHSDRATQIVLDATQPYVSKGTLRVMHGSAMLELLPNTPWDKGDAVEWIHQRVRAAHPDVTCVYVGDDVTDEDAFRVVRDRGLAIGASGRVSGDFNINGPAEVARLIELLAESVVEHRLG
jgi:trehalose 6-phosphate phosphatase